jgi:hypothetical protein
VSVNPIEMRLKLHDRIVDGYAKLQVCLCLLSLRKDLIRASIRGCKGFVEVVKLVNNRRRHREIRSGRGGEGVMICDGRFGELKNFCHL